MFSINRLTSAMADDAISDEHIIENSATMTRNQRYHLLNREVRLQKQRDKYNNDPEVIAKRQEKERKKAEKEAQKKAEKEANKEANKEARRQQKQLELQDKIKLAAETKRVRKVNTAEPA